MFRFNETTIRSRLLIGFILIGITPVIAATIGSFLILYRNGQTQETERLQAVAVSKENAINSWIKSVRQELLIVENSDQAHDRITIALELALGRKADNSAIIWYNNAVRQRLNQFIGGSTQFEELFLVDAIGRVWLSTDPSQEGENISNEAYFQQGLIQPFFALPAYGQSDFSSPLSKRSAIMAIPVTDLSGQVVGVLCGRVRLGTLETILDKSTGLGQSGKAYLVSPRGALAVGSSKLRGAITNGSTFPTTVRLGVKDAFNSYANGWNIYDDYRGVRVIGVYRWLLPQQPVVLFVEQDQSEALVPILADLGIHLATALAALLLAIGLSLIIRRGIVNPLENLAETATKISLGDLYLDAQVEHKDEVGILAQAFNRMTGQLRTSIVELEQRVEERTSDLRQLTLHLETSLRVSREISSILDLDDLLRKVTDLIRDAFSYYGVNILLLDSEKRVLELRGNEVGAGVSDLTVAVGPGSLNGFVAQTNEALMVNDVSRDPRYQPNPLYPDTRSEMVVPIRIGSRIIGTLDLQSSQLDAFEPDDMPIAQGLADQLAIAIENAHLYERNGELAVVEERNRLARALHDSMSQALFSVVLFAGAAKKEAENSKRKSVQHYLARIESMTHQALKEMRLMIYELRPIVLVQRGLIGALQQRLKVVEENAGIKVRFSADGDFNLAPELEEALYRIAQEALNNSLKHAAATSVDISLCIDGDRIEVVVADNGIGFNLDEPVHQGAMGLLNMRERAERLGGSLRVESGVGIGTRVQILVNRRDECTRSAVRNGVLP